MRCDGCGRDFRKGKRRKVFLAGELVSRTVCGSCAGKAIAIVVPSRDTPCKTCKADATFCGNCANSMAHKAVRASLQPFAEHLRKMAKAYRLDCHAAHEGLDMAADILDAARAVIAAPDDEDWSVYVDDEPSGGPFNG